MKKCLFAVTRIAILVMAFGINSANAQKSLAVNDYVAVTMDLQGILELRMSTEPQVDFVFNDLNKYQKGITKLNATVLEVNSTVPWDLYVQPASQYWTQQARYSNTMLGQNTLPAEVLELKSYPPNIASSTNNFNDFIGLSSNMGKNVVTNNPGFETQFIAGGFNKYTDDSGNMRKSQITSVTNKFTINYRIKPGAPANFPDLNVHYPSIANRTFTTFPYVQPGFYALEVVYTLTEDL